MNGLDLINKYTNKPISLGKTSSFIVPAKTQKQIEKEREEKIKKYNEETEKLRRQAKLTKLGIGLSATAGTFKRIFSEITASKGSTTQSILKAVVQGTAQSGASIGLTLMGKGELTSEELEPTARAFKDLIFGKEPLRAIETRIAEAEVKTAKFGREHGIKSIEKGALPLAAIGVIGMIGLDFTTGGGKDDVVKLLVKTDKVGDVANILKKIGVADDLVKTYSKVISKLNKADDIVKALDKIQDIQKTTKATTEIGESIVKAKKGFDWKPRQFLQSVKNAEPDVPLKVGGQYVPRSTDRLAIKAKNLIIDNIDQAETIARTQTDDTAIATASELIKHYSDEATKTTNQALRNSLYDNASEIAHLTARNLTEQGRSVQAASIMGRLTPEGQLRFAAREINKYNEEITKGTKGLFGLKKKIPQLTAKQSSYILNEAKKIEKMEDGIDKAMAFGKLNDHIVDLVPTPFYKKMITVWKAGLLTGIKTSGLNSFSNLFHGASETIKDIPAAAIDNVASLFTKERTLTLTTKGTLKGTGEGFKKGWRYLATGFDERNVGAKLDYQRISFGKSKIAKAIQKYEESIFHLMGAEDQPFYYGAKARSLFSQAGAMAKNKGVKGLEKTKFIDDLIKSPTDEMLRYAMADAEIAVFQNQTMLGKMAKGFQKIPGGEVIVPFGRTPASVANQLINYSPIGIVKTIANNIGKGKFDQRLFSQGLGRGITGSAIMYLGTKAFVNNLISLDYPTSEKERELWKLEGRTPNSIKIGSKWRNLNIFGPAGMVLLTGAQFQNALEKEGSIVKALVQATFGGAKSLTEQTFLRGLNQVTQALADPERSFTGWFSNTIASVIPTIISDISRAFDPYERRTEGVFDALKKRIPGVRQTIEPQITVLGEKRKRAGTWWETMFDPSRPSKIISTPVIEELRRLFDAGYNISPSQLGNKNGYDPLTPEENTSLWEKTGELLNSKLGQLLKLPEYIVMDNDDKNKIIQSFVDKSHLYGRVQALMELTEGMSGEELKNKLKELKDGNFLTKEVLTEFLKLR